MNGRRRVFDESDNDGLSWWFGVPPELRKEAERRALLSGRSPRDELLDMKGPPTMPEGGLFDNSSALE